MTRLNILQIVCHDLGQHLGCYGQETVHTPVLDRLAGQGIRFENSFCTSPGCSPSRAALATGRYPHTNGCLGLAHAHFGWELGQGEQHVSQILRQAGYRTSLFGLQHVVYDVGRLQFEDVYPGRPADDVAANLERHFQQAPDDRPFYIEVNFFEPHRPFDFGRVGPDTERGCRVPPYLPETDESRQEVAALQGAIRKVDDSVGRILAALERSGAAPGTIVLFTADHGLAFPRAKGTLYDAGIKVALIVRTPIGSRAGTAVEALVSNVDVVPTYLELAQVPVPGEPLQGRSFAGMLSGGDTTHRQSVFAEKTFHEHYDPQRCIRTARHKLIFHFEVSNRAYVPTDIARGPAYPGTIHDLASERGMVELYDLREDPLERRNLADAPQSAGVLRELTAQLAEWMRETRDPVLDGPVPSPFAARALQQLNADRE